jgi:hypothetical protein
MGQVCDSAAEKTKRQGREGSIQLKLIFAEAFLANCTINTIALSDITNVPQMRPWGNALV